jgi:ubiquitin C-terminal hydrolase
VSKSSSILLLHLRRFKSNGTNTIKITSRFSFPPEFDASPFFACQGSSRYVLIGVLAHSGTWGRAHYVAYLRVGPDLLWYGFSDLEVTLETESSAVNGTFGGVNGGLTAYMLIYVKQDELVRVLL